MSRRIEFKKIINLLTGNYLFPMTHGSIVVDDDGNAWSEKGAQVNVIEKVKVNGTALTPDADKAVNIELSQSEQIQSDWNQSDNTKKDFIKNKPTIPSISGLESASNKVTSFQTTPDNTHYPSEKLVKDSLDAKQNTIDSSHKLDYSLLDNTPTIPTVPTISTDISTDATSDTKTASPKAVKTYVDSNIPSVPVTDVTVGGTSVVSNGTAVIPAIPDTSNLIAKSSTTGLVKNDGTIDTNTYLTQHQDISGKADKVSGATSGNFAGLDANGNLTDSGKKPSDFLTQHQDMTNYVQKSQTAGLLKNDGTVDTNTYLTSAHEVPAGGNAGQVLKKNSATDYDVSWADQTQHYPSALCTTAAGTAAKKANCSLWVATANSYLHVLIGAANTSASALTLNVNSAGAKPIYINGTASSSTNYTLPAGSYLVFYDGTNFQFRTDGKIPGINGSVVALLSDLAGKQNTLTPGTGISIVNDVISATGGGSTGTPEYTIPNTTASQELAPNTAYIFDARTNDLTLTLGTPIVGQVNEYHFIVVIPSATSPVPTITLPNTVEWEGNNAPTYTAGKTYEVSIYYGIASYFEI